ncbi:protein phosphatase [Halovenus sp. WSH3]|uniref:Protein phosphatase n=1 Tax=Halovenus carboxidivorans TaxID=2692199 RepID=A0A6B0THJ1_9EURY|nr:dual specificity protein phosphatase family protein [Halovenus carboxidivorans]MXR52659.1 protein phosphatase [Halovenus carboxidivorans]
MGKTDRLLQDAHRLGPAAPDEEYVYGSCAPGWHAAADHETCIREWIEDMRAAGMERVCCLIAAADEEAEQANVGVYREEFGADRTLHASIPTGRLATPERLGSEILPFLEAGKANDEPVVVHGLSGLGRTGQVLAAWLAYDRGYRPERAVRIVQEYGRDPVETVRDGPASEADLFEVLETVRERA